MTNLELLNMNAPQPPLVPKLLRVGRIRFTREAWEGATSEVDFPLTFAQMGMVAYEVDARDIRTRLVEVLYRWDAFPAIEDGSVVPFYEVSVGLDSHRNLSVVSFKNMGAPLDVLTCLRDHDLWIINPSSADLRRLGDTTSARNEVTGKTREVVQTRRIIVNR